MPLSESVAKTLDVAGSGAQAIFNFWCTGEYTELFLLGKLTKRSFGVPTSAGETAASAFGAASGD